MASQILEIGIRGMSCASCVARVEKALNRQPGVAAARVNLATERARVEYDPAATSAREIAASVDKAGYAPVVDESELSVRGMTCASCVARVERALRKLPGVIEASVNLASERVRVRYFPASTGVAAFRQAIASAGYEVRVDETSEGGRSAEEEQRARELAAMRRRLAEKVAEGQIAYKPQLERVKARQRMLELEKE